MKKANYIVFDCETGGLKCEENPILEIALVTLDVNLKEINRYETYVKPYDNLIITKGALEANGIKIRDCETQGITKKELIKNIAKYFKDAKPGNHASLRPIVVGHNIPFDIGFMTELFKDEKVKFSDLKADVYIDTMADAKRTFPNIEKLQLGKVCEEAGISLINAHRAMPDVLATADLLRYFTNKLKADKVKVSSIETEKEKSRSKFQF